MIEQGDIKELLPFFELLQKAHFDARTHLKAELIYTSFMALLFQITRLSVYQHEVFESQRFKVFLAFKQLLSEKHHVTHNANEYADKLGVSYKYLNDVCKEICSQTAKSFIDAWLLLEIKRNISEQKYTSQEIAFKMGFSEPSNFIRFFKKHTGLTPSQFQKQKPLG